MWLWLVLVSIWIPFSLTLLSESSWLQIVRICCHPFFLNHLSQFELACYLGFNCFFFLLRCFAIHLGGFHLRFGYFVSVPNLVFHCWINWMYFMHSRIFLNRFHIIHVVSGLIFGIWNLMKCADNYPREMRWYETGVWSLSFVLWMPDFWLGLWFHCFGTMALTSSIQSGIMTHGNGLAWQPVPLRYVLILSPVTSSIPSFVCKLEHSAWHGLNPLLMSCQKSIATLS